MIECVFLFFTKLIEKKALSMRWLVSFLTYLVCWQPIHAAPASHVPLSEIYLGSREGDPASIVENVSTIHGDYTEVEVDVTVSSPDTLVLSRFYSSKDTLSVATFGGWRFNPHCFLRTQKDLKAKTYSSSEGTFERTFAYVGNPDGSILTYVGWKNLTNPSKRILFKLDPEEACMGMANTARGDVGAWTNLKNNALYYNPQDDSFELLLCTEGKRFYAKNSTDCYFITHEILPSGNKVFYTFNTQNQLELIKETNASEKKVLAWIKMQHDHNNGNTMHLETSEGKTVDYHFQHDSIGLKLLKRVVRSDKPELQYQYQVIGDHALLIKKTLPEGRFVHVDYITDLHDGSHTYKVRSVTIPGGPDNNSTTHFSYDQNSTTVDGPGARKAVYRFDDHAQLVAVEQYLNGSIYRIYQKAWGKRSDAGNLISTSVADGCGNIFYHQFFIYDKEKNNLLEEREYGDIVGTGALTLAVDEEGCVTNQDGHIKNYFYFSGKTSYGSFQRDAKGTGVKCWYKKGTNLLIKKLILTNGSLDSEEEDFKSGIQQRFFYVYNEDAALMKVVIDDGKEGELNNLYSVKQRTITDISPKQHMPNVGAPESIEQKYTNNSGKSEFLLKKTINLFDPQGNISSQEIYDATHTHRYTRHKQYANGLLILETDPMGNQTHYSYDANHNLKTVSHADTRISIEYGYDLRNRLIHILEKDSTGRTFETHITYDASGYKNKETDRFGNETLYENDALGRPISITYPEIRNGLQPSIRPTYTYAYDLFDNPVSVTDPQGRVLKSTYTVKGALKEIQYPDGTKEQFRYDTGGNLHHHWCRNGLLKVYEYDYIGRTSKVSHGRKGSNGSDYFKTTSYDYDAFYPYSETDGRGKKTYYTYDGAGRLVSMKKEKQKVDFSYDSLGRIQSVKRWKSATDFTLEVKEHDLLDRLVEERCEDSAGHILLRKKYVYDGAGNLAQIIGYPQNQESVLISYEYDGFGRVVKAIPATGNAIQILYDDLHVNEWGQKGRKRTIIDPMGNAIEEIFDHEGHLIQTCKKDPTGKRLSCTETSYDDVGNKVLEKAFGLDGSSKDFEMEYAYSQGNQLEAITIGKGTPEERTTRFAYNTYGELKQACYPGAQTPIVYQYDKRGDLERVSYKEDAKTISILLNYDLNSNLTYMNHGDTLYLSYVYDENALPTSETVCDAFGKYQVSRTYDGEGKVKTLQFPDGSYVEYSYEGSFVKSISRFNKDKKELYALQVTSRDQMGNILEENLPGQLGTRTQVWDEASRRTGIMTDFFHDKVLEYDPCNLIKRRESLLEEQSYTAEYDYNALLQLTAEKGAIEHDYSYDAIGNRLKKDGSCYTVNGLNQLLEAGKSTYTFHPNGNVATKTAHGKTWTYQSNPLNHIVSIQDADQSSVTFTYDLTGRRLSKRMDFQGKKRTLRFFYIDDMEIGSLNEKGGIVELKIPSDPNHPEAPAIAIEIKNNWYFPIYDLQGNVACLVDSSKRRVVESYRYSVYGEEEIINNKGRVVCDSSVGNPWRFQGKRIDKEVGLIYFGYRYYDPEIGRWISPDPMGTIDGPNLYVYVRNNPMKYSDGFGLNAQLDDNCRCVLHDHPGWHHAPSDCVCICGRNGASIGSSDSYRSKRGSDIKSALGGITHGIADFLLASAHDLQIGTAYLGSRELEMSLHEKMQMIQAIEESQRQQIRGLDIMVTIDELDAVYQSFRAKTTLGLEVGSLIAGGYGAVKGVIGFSKLARMPVKMVKAGIKDMRGMENAFKVGNFRFTNSAGCHMSELVKRGPFKGELLRPYMKSPHTIHEIMVAGKPIPDPGGISGGLRWDVPGSFRCSEGTWELVFAPRKKNHLSL